MVGSKWSLVDYRRRVSPSVTIQAVYDSIMKFDIRKKKRRSTMPGVLGLAVGGQMYDALDLALSIVYFNPIIFRAQKIYRDKDSPRVWCNAHFNFRIS